MKKALQALNGLERDGVIGRYAIGGAMGATFYVEPFTTFDLDVFVVLPEAGGLVTLAPLYLELAQRGYPAREECVMVEGIPVPLPARTPLLDEALAQARDVPYEDVPTRVFGPEHLVAVAVQAGRAKDRQRVQMFLDAGVLDRKRLDEILSRQGLMERFSQWTRNA
ncbi:MAG: hypothetical protein EOM72_01345 [Opitutae bacterium]|nr:hypothetical protein [Opitutae bacterium]